MESAENSSGIKWSAGLFEHHYRIVKSFETDSEQLKVHKCLAHKTQAPFICLAFRRSPGVQESEIKFLNTLRYLQMVDHPNSIKLVDAFHTDTCYYAIRPKIGKGRLLGEQRLTELEVSQVAR
jgi:hypothetical protein